MSNCPGIHLKAIPENIFDLIIDKQTEVRKKQKKQINASQAVILLLKEAYIKDKL